MQRPNPKAGAGRLRSFLRHFWLAGGQGRASHAVNYWQMASAVSDSILGTAVKQERGLKKIHTTLPSMSSDSRRRKACDTLDFVKHTECKGFPRRSSHCQARESEKNFTRLHQDSCKWQKPISKYLKEKCIGSWTGEILDQVGRSNYFLETPKGSQEHSPHLLLLALFSPRSYWNANPCAQQTVRQNNTKTWELGAEKGLLQGPARSWVAHALKVSNLLPCVQVSIPGPGRSHMPQSN